MKINSLILGLLTISAISFIKNASTAAVVKGPEKLLLYQHDDLRALLIGRNTIGELESKKLCLVDPDAATGLSSGRKLPIRIEVPLLLSEVIKKAGLDRIKRQIRLIKKDSIHQLKLPDPLSAATLRTVVEPGDIVLVTIIMEGY